MELDGQVDAERERLHADVVAGQQSRVRRWQALVIVELQPRAEVDEIRVKRGLTYGVYSRFLRNRQAGEFFIGTFTKNVSTGEVVQIALGEVKKLGQTPPASDELADRKTFLNGNFAVQVATPTGLRGSRKPLDMTCLLA